MKQQKKTKGIILNGLKLLIAIASVFIIAIATQEISQKMSSSPIETEPQQAQVERQTEVPAGYTGIYDAAGLKAMADDLAGKYILMADIDMTGVEWTPVGTSYSSAFTGVFDGNYYTISNLNIESEAQYVGMFGYTKEGDIKNIILDTITIIADYTNKSEFTQLHIGGLVGYSVGINGSTTQNVGVENVKIKVTQTDKTLNIGGLVGNNSNLVTQAYSTGYIEVVGTAGNINVGGLIGRNSGTISETYSMADIKVDSECTGGLYRNQYIGGLVGEQDAYWITNSYTKGRLVGHLKGSGIVNCYTIEKSKYDEKGGLYSEPSNSELDEQITNSYWSPETIEKDASIAKPKGARLFQMMLYKDNYKNWDFDNIWQMEEGETLPYLRNVKNVKKIEKTDYTYLEYEGKGNSEFPLLIKTTEQLQAMNYQTEDVCYKLANDITWDNNTIFYPIGISDNISMDFDGKAIVSPFSGEFDGDGHTITNLKMYLNQRYVGLFGTISSGTVKNLNLENVTIESSYTSDLNKEDIYIGGVVGDNQKGRIENIAINEKINSVEKYNGQILIGGVAGNNSGTIENVSVNGIISREKNSDSGAKTLYIGGISGRNSGIINKSYNKANITAVENAREMHMGGVVGQNRGTISQTYNKGNITAPNTSEKIYVGGLVGNHQTIINNSYNVGNITITEPELTTGMIYTGGIAGYGYNYSTKIENTYTIGKMPTAISGRIMVGGIIGGSYEYRAPTTVTKSYWSPQIVGIQSNSEQAKTTRELLYQDTYETWDFDSIWKIDPDGGSSAYLREIEKPEGILREDVYIPAMEPFEVAVYRINTTIPLVGATISIYDTNGKFLIYKDTEDNGTVKISGLGVGEYYYQETRVPNRYVLNNTKYNFTVNDDETVTFAEGTTKIIYNKLATMTRIEKRKTGTSEGVEGAVIGLFDESGNAVLNEANEPITITTESQGSAYFVNLQPGTYQYKEIQPPEGYILNDTMYTFTINYDGKVTYESNNGIIYNEIIKADVIITKYKTGTTEPLAIANFGLFSNGEPVRNKTGDKVEAVTDHNGIATFKNIEPGTYTYKELSAPSGYIKDNTSYWFRVNPDGSVTYGENKGIVYNDPLRRSINVKIHQAGTNHPIPGAVIGIYDKENNPVIGTSGTPIIAITDDNGEAIIPDIEFGDYTYKVESVPGGYVKPEGEYKVTINTEGNVEHENGTGIIESEKVKAEHAIIRKYRTGSEMPLAGATIGIFDENGNKFLEVTTNENGQADFTNLEVGTYKYQELNAPPGYIKDETMYEVIIDNNGNVNFTTNEGVIYNDRVTTESGFIVTKYIAGTETPLAGAVIGLFDREGNKLDEKTTDANGQVDFGKLEVGSYYYKELTPPEGYVLNDTEYQFTVENNGSITLATGTTRIIYNDRVTMKESFTVTKYRTETEVLLAGAVIGIFDIENNKVKELTTTEEGTVEVSGLEVGSYYYQELSAPEGYVLNNTKYNFIVENDGTVTFAEGSNKIIYNDRVTTESGFIVTKYRARTETPLAGAVIGLFDGEGNKLDEQTTDANGQVDFGKLEVGSYYYKELTPPAGYILNNTEYHFTVENDGTITFGEYANGVIYNEPIKVDVTIQKYKTGTTIPVVGATITVLDSKGNEVDSKVTGENGQVVFNLEVGSYHYKETIAPEGYVLNSTMYSFTIANDETVTFASNTKGIIYNKPVQTGIIITKYRTGTETPLEGAVIGLFDEVGNKLQERTTNENGQVLFENVEVGTYKYQELEAPAGYVRNETVYEVTIRTDGSVNFVTNNGIIYNDRVTMKESFNITKYRTRTETPLSGAVIGIIDAAGNKLTQMATDENGTITVSGLEVGNYYYQELEAPVGYVRNETMYGFKVNDDGTVTFTEGSNKIIYNNRVTMTESFTITKYRTETTMPLSGATIGIFSAEGSKIAEATTTEEGTITVSGLEVGSYYYQELEAPAGYVLNAAKYNFTVNDNGTVTFAQNANKIIYNDRVMAKEGFTVTKYRAGTETPLAGAVIGLFDSAGNKLQEKTTGENGQVDFGKLEVGSYYYKELTPLEGYVLNDTEYHFTVENNGSITLATGTTRIIYNDRVTMKESFTITKYRTETEVPLAGAVIGIFDIENNKVKELTTTEEGTIEISGLEVGSYYYQETKAPEGYVLNSTRYNFRVENDGTVTFAEGSNKIIYNDRVTTESEFIVTKYRAETETPLAGAVIGLFDEEGNKLDEKTTDANGQVDFGKLEVGSYYYKELTPPEGYVLNDTEYHFTVENNGSITLATGTTKIIYNDRVTMKESFTITKYRTETEMPLAGAVIGIFDIENNKVKELTTTEEGTVEVSGLEVGSYYYQETKAPEGYVLNNTKYNFTVENDGTVTFAEKANKIIYNTPIKTNVVITKYREGTNTPLAGATITILDREGNKLDEKTTGTNGQVTFNNLEVGTYSYQELQAPLGYVRNETMYRFTIANDGTVNFENGTNGIIYNTPVKSNVIIMKYRVDSTTPLAGAVVGLFDREGNKLDEKTTGSNGMVLFNNLEVGTYKYQELTPPAGYLLNNTMYQFTINNDGSITYGENEGIIYNTPVRSNVVITKYRIDSITPLAGAVIGLFDGEGHPMTTLNGEQIKGTTTEEGTLTILNLEPGTYSYQELQAPLGYVRNETMYRFTIANDGAVNFENGTNGIIYNEPVRANVTIIKYKTGTQNPVAGATIALFDRTGNKLEQKVTLTNGTVTFNRLEVGTYRYQELQAPAGYILNSTVYEFTVNADGSITFGENDGIIYNEPVRANVTITKYETNTETPLAGAIIGLFNRDGNKLDEKTTSADGKVIFSNLEVGQYRYQELQAPIGYTLNNTIYEFSVNIDGSITYGQNNGIIYNNPIKSSAIITKYITGTTAKVSGATIGLFDRDGNKLDEKITGEDGCVIFENLEIGTYRYQELVAPAGYILNNTVYEFTVNTDGSITYSENNGIIYNDTIKANVVITKRITGTTTPLAGAVIGLFDASGNKLNEKTTDETGKAVFENLEAGMYTYKELQAPLGYVLNDKTYIVAVNIDGSVHYAQNEGIIYNDLIKTDVTITKYITGTTIKVKGATIGLFDIEGNKLDEKTTDTNGTVTFSGLTKGNYQYKELQAPLGYILNNTTYTFTVNTDGSITYGENNGIIYNDVITANATITKYETNTKLPVSGAVIGLFDTAGNKLLESKTGENGTVTFSGLTKGSYYYQELRAPAGYVLNNEKYTLTVDENGNVTYGQNNGIIYNDKIVIEEIKGKVTISKFETGTNKQLAGAVIGLFDEARNKLDEKITDTAGQVTFSELKAGTYYYKELQAPTGYVLNYTMYQFTVNEDGSISYAENKGIIYNDKIIVEETKVDVVIIKQDTKTKELLAGAKIGLFDNEGNSITELETNQEGKIVFRELKPGTYKYKELVAPEGYKLNEETYQFTIDEKGNVQFESGEGILYNEKIEKPEEPQEPEKPEEPIKPEEPTKPEPPKDKPIIDNLPNFLPQTGEQMVIVILITMAMGSATYYGMKLYKQKKQ